MFIRITSKSSVGGCLCRRVCKYIDFSSFPPRHLSSWRFRPIPNLVTLKNAPIIRYGTHLIVDGGFKPTKKVVGTDREKNWFNFDRPTAYTSVE